MTLPEQGTQEWKELRRGSDDGQTILEIKKNNVDFHEMARSEKSHRAHNAQIQWQMFCAGVENCSPEVYLQVLKNLEIGEYNS